MNSFKTPPPSVLNLKFEPSINPLSPADNAELAAQVRAQASCDQSGCP